MDSVEQMQQADQAMINARFNEITVQTEQERQIQATEAMIAMLGIAMRMRGANPDLADKITSVAVLNYHAPQIQSAWEAQQFQIQHEQQQVAARDFHAKKDDDKQKKSFGFASAE